jgi:hypothetical protein
MAETKDLLMPELVETSHLKTHPQNYRIHPDDQLDHIMASIKKNGLYRNIVIANDGTILAGHGVVLAAKKLGMEVIPAIRLSIGPDDPVALKILVGDNEIEHLATQDDRVLSNLLKTIKDTDIDGLLGTGYDERMLAALAMVTRPMSEIKDFDAAAEWVGMPEYDAGPKRIGLSVWFEDEEVRMEFINKFGFNVGMIRKSGHTWNTPWPQVELRDDLTSLKLDD